MSAKLTLIQILYILFLIWPKIKALCPDIPKCNCSNLSGKNKQYRGDAVKVKCSRIESVESTLFSNLANISSSIVHLEITNSNLSVIPSKWIPFPELTKLELDKNSIQHIADGAFSNLRQLKILILSNNKLSKISKPMFEGLDLLENLKLNKNYLTTISSDIFGDLHKLTKLNISGNPFVCNCDLWWFRKFKFKSVPVPQCDSPVILHSFTIVDFPIDECAEAHKPYHTLQLDPDQNQVTYEGDPLRLTCKLDGFSESDFLMWTWNDQDPEKHFEDVEQKVIVKNDGVLRSTLTINKLTEKHNGEWSCNFRTADVNRSSSVIVEVLSERTVYCGIMVTENDKGHYAWPKTVSGHRMKLPCEIEDDATVELISIPYATHLCSENGTWMELNTNDCPYTSSITRILQQFSRMNLTNHKASLIESAIRLRNFTSEKSENITNAIDFHFIVTTIENYIKFLEKEPELGIYLIQIVSNALKLPKNLMEKAQSARLLAAIESVVKLTPSLEFQNNEFNVKEFLLSSETFQGITCYWVKNTSSDGSTTVLNCFVSNNTFSKGPDVEASVQIPPNLFYHPELEIIPSSTYHLMVAMFKTNHLFEDKNNAKEPSIVLAANFIDTKLLKLDKPIYIKVKNYARFAVPTLAWWDVDNGVWIKDSCTLISPSVYNNILLTFKCFRVGYFSLMSKQEHIMYLEKDIQRKLLFYFLHPSIYVGTFISVTCLLLASATYVFCYSHIQMSKKMKHSLANTWLSTSLFYLVFSLGIYQTEHQLFCQIIGLSIHYFALATLFWMAVTVKALYKRVQKSNPSVSTPSEDIPSDVNIQKPILGIYLVGWGISSILCGIAGAVNMKGYSSPHYCFLTPGPELSTVLIPASLVLFYLLIMCLFIKCATGSLESNPQLSVGTQAIDLELLDGAGRSSLNQEKCSVRSITTPSSQAEDTEHSPARQLKAFVIYLVFYLLSGVCAACCVMLPLRWPYEEKLFSFAYALVCVLLGSFVIFFHCFARNDVRSAWSKLLGEKRFRKSPHIIANSLITPINFRPSSGDPAGGGVGGGAGLGVGAVSKTASTDNNSTRSEFAKQTPNVNLVHLHRQHYRELNAKADNFYNPHQSIVAKKFFKKQRRKRNTLQVRKCRSGGSSPVSADLFDDSAKATGTRTDDENTKFLSNSNGRYDELSSEKHPLTYDEPDITGGEGKTGTESEATFTVPEYAEIQENSVKYGVPYKMETKEQMCGTSDRDWCSCDAVSDVNSEPTYNYAYIRNGYGSSRSVVSDNSSVNSHLYTAVAPDIVSSVDRYRRRMYYRQPVRNAYRGANRRHVKNENPRQPMTTNEFLKRRRKDIACKLPKELVSPTDFSSRDKVETYIKRTAC